ncbi:MAG: hypothetical protein GC154_08285 [bacterium]|nr:hypothetical protein [bacterium]
MNAIDKISSQTMDAVISCACVFALLFVLPHYGGFATVAGGAAVFSLMVYRAPDQYRGRTGSLNLSIGLITALWLMAAAVGGIEWFG